MNTAFLASQFDAALHIPRNVPQEPPEPLTTEDFIEVRNFSVFYHGHQALNSVSMTIPQNQITALIGPSGCGKTTMLRSFNRLIDLVPGCRHTGDILLGNESIFDRRLKLMNLRRYVGLVFQKSNPFPQSIYENIACVLRVTSELSSRQLDEKVEYSLRRAALWDEVKDRLHDHAFHLSGGQMQRLCLARALACNPKILLLDEPCSSLDPNAAARIEELVRELSGQFTIILVTHNLGLAARCAHHLGFFYQGRLVVFGPADEILISPANRQTCEYLQGTVW